MRGRRNDELHGWRCHPAAGALAGIPAERLAMAVDVIKRNPAPPHPLDDALVDALAAEASHLPHHGARAVSERQRQDIVQGLVFVLNTSPNIPAAARIAALIHALAAEPLPLVQRLRELLQQPPELAPMTSLSAIHALLATLRRSSWSRQEVLMRCLDVRDACLITAARKESTMAVECSSRVPISVAASRSSPQRRDARHCDDGTYRMPKPHR